MRYATRPASALTSHHEDIIILLNPKLEILCSIYELMTRVSFGYCSCSIGGINQVLDMSRDPIYLER